MDEIVLRGMLKWPNVPSVYGWLRLDRRGQWLIKTVGGRFERIGNAAVSEFIGRNYASDADGRWYFQNGPQRVYVTLDYTPWVYRLDDIAGALVAHTGAAPRAIECVFLDEAGALLLHTELGIGVLLDRDLAAVLERVADPRGGDIESLIEKISQGGEARVVLQGNVVTIASIRAADVAGRFGFNPRPGPRPGEPEC